MLTPTRIIKKEGIIRIKRELPAAGKVLVKEGEMVKADDVVAKTHILGDLQVEKVGEKLGVPAHEVPTLLAREGYSEGSKVNRGDVLARFKGLFGLIEDRYTANFTGTIEFISKSTGHVGIRLAPKEIRLNAFIDGLITKVFEGKGVEITARGGIMQGIFGIGGEQRGAIRCLDSTVQTLDAKHLEDSLSECVIVSRGDCTSDALRKAQEIGIRGVIVGSLGNRCLKDYLGYDISNAITGKEDIPLTVIAMEGFGQWNMFQDTWKLFQEFEGQMASINGATQVRAGARRPEIFISQGFEKEVIEGERMSSKRSGFAVGKRVICVKDPFIGVAGTIVELPVEPIRIETGAWVRCLKVKTDDNRKIMVPRANVELKD